ncbi:MAG: hypothetical protein FJW36_10870 [Acidobacteria bacterium]|nr:hypothetical protein [Acidobacteriota bacterium]
MKYVLCFLVLLVSCSTGPGSTPMEQDGLKILDQPLSAEIVYSMDNLSAPNELLVPIFDEYRRTPLILHIVWRTTDPPQPTHLAQFPGKKTKQFWDPKHLTPSTDSKLRVRNNLIPMDRLALRMALARAAAFPN